MQLLALQLFSKNFKKLLGHQIIAMLGDLTISWLFERKKKQNNWKCFNNNSNSILPYLLVVWEVYITLKCRFCLKTSSPDAGKAFHQTSHLCNWRRRLMMKVYVVASIFLCLYFYLYFQNWRRWLMMNSKGGCSKRTTVQKRVISSRKIANLISTCCNGPTQ